MGEVYINMGDYSEEVENLKSQKICKILSKNVNDYNERKNNEKI